MEMTMNKDRVKGTIDEVAGSVKRNAGDLTGNKQLEGNGIIQEVKGKLEVAVGKTKDVLHKASVDADNEVKAEVADAKHPKSNRNCACSH
jgi:uncharacterized protein YjbJ (UPF0337 family)